MVRESYVIPSEFLKSPVIPPMIICLEIHVRAREFDCPFGVGRAHGILRGRRASKRANVFFRALGGILLAISGIWACPGNPVKAFP